MQGGSETYRENEIIACRSAVADSTRLKSFNLLKAASMRQRSLYRRALKLNSRFLFERFRITDLVTCSARPVPRAARHCHTLCRRHTFWLAALCGSGNQQPDDTCASPPVNRIAIRRPLTSASAWIFVLRPPRERPTACFCSPLSAGGRSVGFHIMKSIICVSVDHPLFRQALGTDSQMPRHPSEQIGYRSLSKGHIRVGNDTSGSSLSTHARCR